MYCQPDKQGHFGDFGGRYIPETLIPLILEIEKAYKQAQADPNFAKDLNYYHKHFTGRPSPLMHTKNLSREFGGAKIYCKREELNHTGAHKINNCLGQVLLAMRMGKKNIIAETGAGQHGVATATVCAFLGLPCKVFMGSKDIERQSPNVFRMKLLGAEVISVDKGSSSLKDAMNETLRYWANNIDDTYYVIGTVAGPHPYPEMVRNFQRVIGIEAKEQFFEAEGKLPDAIVACIGGGSNSIGLFHPFIDDKSVKLYGVEAAGQGIASGKHAASITAGQPGIVHGNKTYLLQDDNGQILEADSISAGLDYPGIGPEHAYLHSIGRVTYVAIEDKEALAAFQLFSQLEGIIPALEPSHAIAYVQKLATTMKPDQTILFNLCGRGDKDINTVAKILNIDFN